MSVVGAQSEAVHRSAEGVEWLSVSGWERHDWMWHGFSTRRGGVSRAYLPGGAVGDSQQGELNLGFTAADAAEAVGENRRRFAQALTGDGETPLRLVRQVHSNCSVAAGSEWAAASAPDADGLMTSEPGVLIGVLTADCIPVLVADPVHRVVGAFHAGWRGTVEGIVALGVERMGEIYGCVPAAMEAAIGPGIGQCCYTVGDEVRARFRGNFRYADELFRGEGTDGEGGLRLNLTEANRRQLLDAGLDAAAISSVGGCTHCQPEWFFSHRASGGHAGRMMAAIGIRRTI